MSHSTLNGFVLVVKPQTYGKEYKEIVNGKSKALSSEDMIDRVEIVRCPDGVGLEIGDTVIISTPMVLKEQNAKIRNQDTRKVKVDGKYCYLIRLTEIITKVTRDE